MKILEWGIYLIVFCLPLYLVKFSIFGIPTTALELMIYGLFIIWLINKFQVSGFKFQVKKLFTVPLSHCFIAILLIFIGATLATIFSSDLRTSAGIWKGWFIDPLLFFVVLVSVIKNSKEKPAASRGKQAGPSKCEVFVGVLYSLLLSGAVVSIISLIYLIQGNLDIQGRLQAFYNSPNYLAMYLAPALILGFGLWIIAKRRSEKILLFIVLCFMFYVLWHTNSFGALLGIIAAIFFGLLCLRSDLKHNLRLRSDLKRKAVLLILVLTVVLVLILGYFALNFRAASLNARLIIWQKAIEIFKENPILGIGPGTFGTYFPFYPEWGGALSAPEPALSAGVPQPHNLYLAFLLQTGIIGFIGFVWLLVWFFRSGIKWFIVHSSQFTVILMSVMVYILVHGLVDTTYWKNDLAVAFWLIIGLMVVLKIEKTLLYRESFLYLPTLDI